MRPRLEARGISVRAGDTRLVEDVSLTLAGGEVVALVGSSGSGKSLTARALLDLVPFRPGRVAGAVTIDGAPAQRGHDLGLVPQDARGALNPMWTLAAQVRRAARLAETPHDALSALVRAGFADPERVAGLYPHELSGGMAQRGALAVALARRPRFLIADEPTTGLDPTVQIGILRHLRSLVAEGLGLLFITHDLRVLPGFADRVLVMEAGRIVEHAATPAQLVGPGRALYDATTRIAAGAL